MRVAYNRRSVVERVAKVFGVPLSHGRIVSARLNGAIALDICRDFTFCSAECEAIYIRRSRKTLGGRLWGEEKGRERKDAIRNRRRRKQKNY